MKRMGWAAIVLGAALGLSACGQNQTKADAPAAETGGLFPNLFQASYRAEANVHADEGVSGQIVTMRSGRKMRMEFRTGEGQMIQVFDPEAQTAYTIIPAQRTAMRISLDQVTKSPIDDWQNWGQGGNARQTGACQAAGEGGQEWTVTEEGGAIRTGCISRDGIILRATDGDRVVWETTRIQRGPQDASLFSVPAGYRVVDLTEMMKGLGPVIEEMRRRQSGQ